MNAARPLPGWPRVLNEAWAAAYVGVSPTTFREKIAPELREVWITEGRKGWLIEDLNAFVDRRKTGGASSAGANPW